MTEFRNDEPLPCPFCGGTTLKSGGDDKVVGYWCLTCQAAGPNHYGSHEWNDRISSPGKDGGQEVEAVAKLVYEAMRIAAHECDPDREKPQWVEGGNSLMQDQARRIARSISDPHPARLPVAFRWRWKDNSTWILSNSEPDEHERRIVEPLFLGGLK